MLRILRGYSTLPSTAGRVPLHSPLAGVSPAYAAEHASLVAGSARSPTVYTNPGAYGHVSRLSDLELLALPPPRKPLYPISEASLTLRYLRSVSLSLVMAGLALYLHAKAVLSGAGGGGAREELEAHSPRLLQAMVACGLASDFELLENGGRAELDVAALAGRVFDRFAVPAGAMPATRAARIFAALGCGTTSSSTLPTAPLSREHFKTIFQQTVASERRSRVYLSTAAHLGVVAASPLTLSALEDLFQRIVAGRAPGNVFTPAALATLSKEVGWPVDVDTCRRALYEDCVEGLGAAQGAGGGQEVGVKMSQREFVDFMALAASSGGAKVLEEEPALDAIKVFILLHLGAIRASAGVAPT